jgi:putative oxidoreductase
MLKNLLIGSGPLTPHFLVALRLFMGLIFIKHGFDFFDPASMQEFADWLGNDLHFPMPLLMAYLRTGAELFGGIFLILGLLTRLSAFLIMFTMLVACFVVDKGDVFGEGEMTFGYSIVMLTILLSGPGKLSLDHLISSQFLNKNKLR